MQNKQYTLTRKASYLGYVIQAVVNNLLSLLFVIFNAQPYGISVERLGRLVFINFMAQLVIDALSMYIVPRFGYRKCVISAQFCSGVGFVLLGILPRVMDPYAGIVIAMLFLAVGSGFIEVLISPIIEALPSDNKAGSMSFLHSFYSWGQALTVSVTTLLLLLIGREHWYWLPFFWSVLPFVNTCLFAKADILELRADRENASGRFSVLGSGKFYVFLLLMLCAGASEIAMVQWSSFFVEVGFSVPKWIGDLLGPCMFAILMGLGRMLYGLFGNRIPVLRVITVSALVCIGCYLLVAFSSSSVLSVIGCAVCGLSISVMWPGTLSLASACFKQGGSALFSMLAMFGDLGCALGPWLLGLVSDLADSSGVSQQYAVALGLGGGQPGMQLGFLAASVFPLMMLTVLLLARRRLK